MTVPLGYYFNRTYPPVAECTPEQLQAIFTGMCQHLLPRVFEFVLGMTGAFVWQAVNQSVKARRGLGTVLELGAIGLVGLQMYYLIPLYAFVFSVGGLPATNWWITSGGCLSFVVLVMVMACEWGWVSRALALRPLVFLGEICTAFTSCIPFCSAATSASAGELCRPASRHGHSSLRDWSTCRVEPGVVLLRTSGACVHHATLRPLDECRQGLGRHPAVPCSAPATATEAETRRAA